MLLIPVVILGCQKPKDYAELSGKITNPNSQQITLSNETGYEKTIVVNSDGTFSDTLKVSAGRYIFTDGNEYGTVYLENGNKTSFTLDTNAFDETLKSITTSLIYTDVTPKKTYFITLNQWFDESLLNEDSSQNLYFPSINKKNFDEFKQEYFKKYSSEPNQISLLGFDLVGLIFYLSKANDFPSIVTTFFMCCNAFINKPLPVPPSGLSDITSSFKITAGQYDKFLYPCIKKPMVLCMEAILSFSLPHILCMNVL